jgi:DNA-binding response OmpR family regulator
MFYRILIIEDDTETRRALALQIKSCGLIVPEVFEEGTLAGGLGVLREGINRHKRIDVVILDKSLPDEMGLEDSIRRIREADKKAAIYVLSGYVEMREAARTQTWGADDCRTKPPDSIDRLIWGLVLAVARRRREAANFEELNQFWHEQTTLSMEALAKREIRITELEAEIKELTKVSPSNWTKKRKIAVWGALGTAITAVFWKIVDWVTAAWGK